MSREIANTERRREIEAWLKIITTTLDTIYETNSHEFFDAITRAECNDAESEILAVLADLEPAPVDPPKGLADAVRGAIPTGFGCKGELLNWLTDNITAAVKPYCWKPDDRLEAVHDDLLNDNHQLKLDNAALLERCEGLEVERSNLLMLGEADKSHRLPDDLPKEADDGK